MPNAVPVLRRVIVTVFVTMLYYSVWLTLVVVVLCVALSWSVMTKVLGGKLPRVSS